MTAAPLPAPIDTTTLAQTVDVAKAITRGDMDLEALATVADKSLTVQNAFARLHILAERQIAQQYLFDADDFESDKAENTLRKNGWTTQRIQRAKRFAQLTLLELDDYLSTLTAEGKEATAHATQKLAPHTPKEQRANFTNAYTAPPIDVEIARELGLAASDHLADVIAKSINTALTNIGPRYAFAWTKYHGITENGTLGDSWTFEGIGQAIGGKSREYAESLYYRASHHVRGQIAMTALGLLQEQTG